MRFTTPAAVALSAGLAAVALAGPTPVAGTIVAREGDAVDGSTIASLNAPFTNGNGQVGFVAALADGRRAIWFDTGVTFLSDAALPDVLTGGEGTMGISDTGKWIYSPSFNGNDAVFANDGLVLQEGTAAPGLDPGINSTFHSRPQMIDDGTAFWVAGFNDGAGGTSTVGRVLYARDFGGSISVVMKSGDVIGGTGGLTIDFPSGVDFDYHSSGNGAHMINTLLADTGSTTNDGFVVVNGTAVARETGATGQGDNWDNFDNVSINNSGNYIFSGDTDGATASDEFLAYNGAISLREDMVVDGLTLGSSVNAASINNLGQAAFIWSTDEATETLFFAGDAADLGSSVALLSVGDLFDAGGETWVVDDFNASTVIGPGLDFAEDGLIYVEVDLESLDGVTNIEAIISLAVPAPTTAALFALGGLLPCRRRRVA